MFHLFRKVYIDFDANIDAYKNRMVISQVNGVPDGAENNFYQGLEVTDLVGDDKDFASELDLFKKCKELSDNNDEQFIIFCDKTAYIHMFIAWHKILLSNIDADSLWSVFSYHIDKETYDSTITGRDEYVQYDDLKLSTWDENSFTALFSNINLTADTSWNLEILNDISVDYLLATDIVSTSAEVKAALKNKIQLLAERTLQNEIYDIKMYAALRSQDKKMHDLLSISNVSSIADFFSTPVLSPLSDSSFWNESKKMVASNKNTAINLENVADKSALIGALKMFRIEQQGQKEDSIFVTKLDWLDWATGTLSDSKLLELLSDDSFCAAELISDTDVHKVNILFIDNILKLYKNNSTDSLSKFVIAL